MVTSTEAPAHALSVGLAAERSRPDQTAVLTRFPHVRSLFFTVVLLVIIAYFLMGGLPLLVLKHDVPHPPMHRFQSRLCHCGL